MYRVYGDILSGNCYKVKLLLNFLGMEHEWVHVDIVAGGTHTTQFQTLNPNAKVPVLVLNAHDCLWESNAILHFLAEETAFLPADKFARAQVLQWQNFEQYSHEPFIAVARYINRFLGLPEERKTEYLAKQEGGHKALAVMEQHLSQHDFFVNNTVTIADISLFAYTHVAEEGGFDLSTYPNIKAWIERIQALPDYLVMAAQNA